VRDLDRWVEMVVRDLDAYCLKDKRGD